MWGNSSTTETSSETEACLQLGWAADVWLWNHKYNSAHIAMLTFAEIKKKKKKKKKT